MIAVVSTTYAEADIVSDWIEHTLAEGVDLILIADKKSNDGTRDILQHWKEESGRVEWVDDDQPYHLQAWWTDRLAAEAHDRGAEWIVPADVDEFVYAMNRSQTVADALFGCPFDKLMIRVWQHKDWATRFEAAHTLSKVAYRWSPDAQVTMGSHEVSLPGGELGVLEMRELKYRDFNHFMRKTAERNATLEPGARQRQDGWHHLRMEGFDEAAMLVEWEQMQAAPCVGDPIPTRMNRS